MKSNQPISPAPLTPIKHLVALYENKHIKVIKALQQENKNWKVTPQQFSQWAKGEAKIPPPWCHRLEKISGGQLTCKDFRPDIFPR